MSLRHREWRVCGSWEDHIQAIHSQSPSYGLRKCLRNPRKKNQQLKNQCLQGTWVDYSFHHMFIPGGNSITNLGNPLETFKIPHKCFHITSEISFHFKVGHQKGLGIYGRTLGSTFQKEMIGVRTLMLPSSPPQALLMKDLVCKFSSKLYEWMEVEISSDMKFSSFTRGEENPEAGATHEPLDMLDYNQRPRSS
jgi:hypothetical protein